MHSVERKYGRGNINKSGGGGAVGRENYGLEVNGGHIWNMNFVLKNSAETL